MTPADIEFQAENTLIQIIPRFTLPAIDLITHTLGPLSPNVMASVPLWLALYFRGQARCHVIPPSWMTPEALTEVKEAEEANQLFTEMPHRHYMEVANLLLTQAPEDIPRANEIRVLLKDIWDLRQSKLRGSVTAFTLSQATTARVSHVTPMELCEERCMLTRAMDQVQVLRGKMRELGVEGATSQTQ